MDVVDHNRLDEEVSLRLLGDKVIFLYHLSRQHCLWKEHLDPWPTFMEWILKFPFLNVLIAIYIFLSSFHLRFVAFYLFNYVFISISISKHGYVFILSIRIQCYFVIGLSNLLHVWTLDIIILVSLCHSCPLGCVGHSLFFFF